MLGSIHQKIAITAIAMALLGRTAMIHFVVTRQVHHFHQILLRPQNHRHLHHPYHHLHLHHRIHLPLNQSHPSHYLALRYPAKRIT